MIGETTAALRLARIRRHVDEEIERLEKMHHNLKRMDCLNERVSAHIEGKISALFIFKHFYLLTQEESAEVEAVRREMLYG